MDISNIHYGKDDKTIIYTRRKAIPQSGPNGYYIYSSTHIIDAVTGEEIRKINYGGVLNITHDKGIAVIRDDINKFSFRVFKVDTWDLLFSVQGGLDYDFFNQGQITFSPDDKYVIAAYGSVTNKIIVYDILSGEEKYSFKSGTTRTIDVSGDGKYLAGGNGVRLILFNFDFQTSVSDDVRLISGLNTYPNPTNNSINVEFDLLTSGNTSIQLFDLSGRMVKIIENKFLDAGIHKYEIDINGLSNGQYNLIIENKSRKISHKILINR
jgi:hypothetical protein